MDDAGLPEAAKLALSTWIAESGPRPVTKRQVLRKPDVPLAAAASGVAKSLFRTATHAIPVLRGTSKRPLFVTAAGVPLPAAAQLVLQMNGNYRIPEALRLVDALTRTPIAPVGSHTCVRT